MLRLMFKFSPYVLCMEILPIRKWMEPQSNCLKFGVQRLFREKGQIISLASRLNDNFIA